MVVAGVLAALLVLTGALGFALPADWALLSRVPAYNLFHIAGGLVGIALVLGSGGRGAVGFNLAFGLIDLYQAVAGSVGLFPAARFAYQPLDDVLHVTLGLGLVGLGALGWAGGRPKGRRGRPRAQRARDRGDLGSLRASGIITRLGATPPDTPRRRPNAGAAASSPSRVARP